MPTVKTTYCDNCKKKMEKDGKYLIYDIQFWSNIAYNSLKKNFLNDNGKALMVCSKECIGEYFSKLLDGKLVE